MPHKRRKKQSGGGGGSTPLALSYGPTQTLLLTYYRQITPLTNLVNLILPDRLKLFVDSVLIASLSADPITLRDEPPLRSDQLTTKDIISRAHDRLFAAHKREQARLTLPNRNPFNKSTPNNQLCLGYRPADIWRGDLVSPLACAIPLVNIQPNATVKEMETSPDWQALLDLIGPQALLDLLSSPSLALYVALPRSCYRQISGTVIYDLKPRSALNKQLDPLDTQVGIPRAESVSTVAVDSETPRPRTGGSPLKRRATTPAFSSLATVQESPASTLVSSVKPLRNLQHTATDDGSPTKRRRLLGPSASVPALLAAPASTLPGPPRLAARVFAKTRSETSLFGGSTAALSSIAPTAARLSKRFQRGVLLKPSHVEFVRHRMHHAKPSKDGRGNIAYGLSKKHVFTRLGQLFPAPPTSDPAYGSIIERRTRHLLKYIFPLQFGIRSAFHAPMGSLPQLGKPRAPNYTDREVDIKRLGKAKTPDRLKGDAQLLTAKMISLVDKCKVKVLLERWCPTKISRYKLDSSQRSAILDLFSDAGTQANMSHSLEYPHPSIPISTHAASAAQHSTENKPKFADFLCDPWRVEKFVVSVVRETIPKGFWGSQANKTVIEKHVVDFLRLRRYEQMTVHTVMQGFSIADCDWLRPRSAADHANQAQIPSTKEMVKRREMLAEFLFWFIDGFVTDLVKTTFKVTEAAGSGSRSLFFRQDDWELISRPLLDNIAGTLFEKIPQAELGSVLQGRTLGHSSVRLVPKATGVRPIINLGKKPMVVGKGGKSELGKAINTLLKPVFDVLTFEKSRKVELVGSLVTNQNEIYYKIRQFKKVLLNAHDGVLPRLYFVKVDVKACFDTINQPTLLGILNDILREETYRIKRRVEVTTGQPNPNRRFRRQATTPGGSEQVVQPTSELHHGVVSDQVVTTTVARADVMRLVREHVTANLIKIGRDYYRQRNGIAQGSVLSSLLCAIQYGKLEQDKLSFATSDTVGSVLLRYVDDFLFVTTDREKATQFLRVMDAGMPEYGVEISTEKRMTSFDASLRPEELIAPCPTADFPWCGLAIDCNTLDVKAQKGVVDEMADRMTVQRHKRPGEGLKRAMTRALRIRTHIIYLDTRHNSPATVCANLYQSFLLLAVKFWTYVREWRVDVRRRPGWFFGVVEELLGLQCALIRVLKIQYAALAGGAECALKRAWVAWLGYHAFKRVLRRSATQFREVLKAIEVKVGEEGAQLGREGEGLLGKVVADESTGWADARKYTGTGT